MKPHYKVNGRIWIETEDGSFLGNGRVQLLENIQELGSLNKAAQAMEMSYKQAWDLINSINDKSRKPLVITQTGGKGGGGATLTPVGEKAVKEFHAVRKKFNKFLKEQKIHI